MIRVNHLIQTHEGEKHLDGCEPVIDSEVFVLLKVSSNNIVKLYYLSNLRFDVTGLWEI